LRERLDYVAAAFICKAVAFVPAVACLITQAGDVLAVSASPLPVPIRLHRHRANTALCYGWLIKL
jgi:hypothetical protein